MSGAEEKQGFRATSLETLRQMVAANVGVTLLPVLAVQPPIARTANVHLTPFRAHAPSRRIAICWRKSSAMHAFLLQFADVFKHLPRALFNPAALAVDSSRTVVKPAHRHHAGNRTHPSH